MKPRTSSLLALAVVLLLGPAALAQDARNMSLLGNFGMGEGDSKAVFGAGSLVFYGLGNKVQIASFSTPSAPVKISSVILGDVVESLVRTSIGGTQYIVACGGSKMWLINVQNPTTPVLVSTTDVAPGTTCEGIATSGSYAYIAAGDAGLKIYNIATPAAPSLSPPSTAWRTARASSSPRHMPTSRPTARGSSGEASSSTSPPRQLPCTSRPSSGTEATTSTLAFDGGMPTSATITPGCRSSTSPM